MYTILFQLMELEFQNIENWGLQRPPKSSEILPNLEKGLEILLTTYRKIHSCSSVYIDLVLRLSQIKVNNGCYISKGLRFDSTLFWQLTIISVSENETSQNTENAMENFGGLRGPQILIFWKSDSINRKSIEYNSSYFYLNWNG